MKISKRHLTLLEVLIAFALVSLALLPLIYPHVYILKNQQGFVHQVELDHRVNLLYGKIAEELYENTIPWSQIQSTAPVQIELKGLPYTGEYTFKEATRKPKTEPAAPYTLYLFSLDFVFKPIDDTEKSILYHYDLFVKRDLGSGAISEPGAEEEVEEDES